MSGENNDKLISLEKSYQWYSRLSKLHFRLSLEIQGIYEWISINIMYNKYNVTHSGL